MRRGGLSSDLACSLEDDVEEGQRRVLVVSEIEGLWRVSGVFTSLEGVEGRDGETPGLCTSVS